ncbi:hypothetical protein HUU51_03055 [Candidatus Gracilibacteria bacterium]|nr:hypothetical protein [Candidatus Gracilibacteria bacterium]
MNKTKQIKQIKKQIGKQIDKSNKSIKIVKSIKKGSIKMNLQYKYYFKILLAVFIILFLVFFIFNISLKNNLLHKFDSNTNKNTILKIEEKLIDNTLYLSNSMQKFELSIANIGSKQITIITEENNSLKKLNNIYCELNLNDFENIYKGKIIEKETIVKNDISRVFFEIDSSKLKDNGYLEITLNCSENSKINEKYSNKLNFEYKKLQTKDKNILILNTTLKPISQSFIDIYNIYNQNGNTLKYMSSIFRSNLTNLKEKDLKNKVLIYYKKGNNEDIFFKNIVNEIKKIDEFNYIEGYETLELNYNNLNKLYFLGDCEKEEKKCNPYLNFDNLGIYYNYFSPKILLNEKNNIDYIIVLGDKVQ